MEITHHISNQICIITLDQNLISGAVKDLHDYLQSFFDDQEIKGIVIDLGNVSYIDSSGFGLLISAYQNSRDSQMKFVLCQVSDKIQELFARMKMDQLLQTYPSEEIAVNTLSNDID